MTRGYDSGMVGRGLGEKVWGGLPQLRRGLGFRHRVAGSLAGAVLEIGFGHGDNFAHYQQAEGVWGIEPRLDGFLEARRHARQAPLPIYLACAVAEALPFPDATFDRVIATLVFCSVDDPLRAFREAHRVLKPGGTLHLFEHVRAPAPALAWVQDRLAGPWEWLTDGCHLNRDTSAILQAAGFRVMRNQSQVKGIVVEIEALRQDDLPLYKS